MKRRYTKNPTMYSLPHQSPFHPAAPARLVYLQERAGKAAEKAASFGKVEDGGSAPQAEESAVDTGEDGDDARDDPSEGEEDDDGRRVGAFNFNCFGNANSAP